MLELIQQLNQYSLAHNNKFQLIGNGALGLYQGPQAAAQLMLNTIGAILTEGVYYSWAIADNELTPVTTRERILAELVAVRKHNLPIFNIDYCSSPEQLELAYKYNQKSGLIGFVSNRELDKIPASKLATENGRNITRLKQVKNFLILLNPVNFASKPEYLSSLGDNNYDLIIIDLYFAGQTLSKQDLAKLSHKKNGGRRLVYAYMSIGEASDYRAYWQPEWSYARPDWIVAGNPNWPGSYKVEYWQSSWQKLLFGSPDAYLDQILNAGFDGVFLDVIDAFEYFAVQERAN